MSAAERLVQLLQLDEGCGVVLNHPSSVRYFTGGFTGEGLVVLTGTRRVIITDSRYASQAHRQAPSFTVVESTMDVGTVQLLSRLCRRDDVTSLRYEDDALTVQQYRQLDHTLGDRVSLLALYGTHHALRQVKEGDELCQIRRACSIADEALAHVLPQLREGMTEQHLAALLNSEMLLLGAESTAFPTVAAFGGNTSLNHHAPGERALQRGDLILLDFGCRVNGYCCDITRMLSMGPPPEDVRRAYEAVMGAYHRCMGVIREGVICREADALARDHLRNSGCSGIFAYALGHGIGLDVHEEPKLSPVCHQPLQRGMVVAVEPGVYLPDQFGVRIEDTVLVTETGCESLTRSTRELIIL